MTLSCRTGAAGAVLLTAALHVIAVSSQRPDSVVRDSAHATRLQTLVVTASGRAQRDADAPLATRVISRAEVDHSGTQDLHALLMQYPGVQAEPSSIGSGGVQIEGMSSQHVLILVDGEPMVGRIDGELDVSRIPTSVIDHVEVISGPVSTMYGSSAMGGVINVITRAPVEAASSVMGEVTAGSQGRRDADISANAGTGTIAAAIDLGRREEDVQPGRVDQSGARARRWDGNLRSAWHASTRWSIDGALLAVREDQRWASGQLYYFGDNTQLDARVTAAGHTGHDGTGSLRATAYVSSFDHLQRQATLPEPVSDSGDRSHEQLNRAQLLWTAPVTARDVVDAGLDLDLERLVTDRILGGTRSDVVMQPYAQYTLNRGALALVPGVRLTSSSQWGTYLTPKLATVWRAASALNVRASVAAGYRAPDFKEQFLTFLNSTVGYVVNGNPSLRPETSTNITVGAQWTHGNVLLGAQAYVNRFHDFIQSIEQPDSGGIEQFTYGNVARGTTDGGEIDAVWSARGFGLDGTLAIVHARDNVTGLPLLGVTPRTARLAVHSPAPLGFLPSITMLYWSTAPASQQSIGFNTVTTYRDAYLRFDVRIARRISRRLLALVGVENLLDAHPANWPGTTTRAWYAGLRMTATE